MEDLKELRNIIDSGLNKDSSHILIILMEISSLPWALLTFKFLIILMTKSSEKGTELIVEFVKYTCLLKKSFKIFALALKSVTNLLLTDGGISGTLLPL